MTRKFLQMLMVILLCTLLFSCSQKKKESGKNDPASKEDDTQETSGDKEDEKKKREPVYLGDEYDLSWAEDAKAYTGDYAYEKFPLFDDAPVLKDACKVIKDEKTEAGEDYVVCKTLHSSQTYHSLKDALNNLEGKTLYVAENGALTKQTVEYNNTLFAICSEKIDEAKEIPGIYELQGKVQESFGTQLKDGTLLFTIYDAGEKSVVLSVAYDNGSTKVRAMALQDVSWFK